MPAGLARIAHEDRVEPRDETLHRVPMHRAGGAPTVATIVNVSPNGFMARCDEPLVAGDAVTVTFPVVGTFAATVRWSLGGRIGCRLSREIAPALYQFMVVAMR